MKTLKVLNSIKKIADWLPEPALLFLALALSILLGSAILSYFNYFAIHPGTFEEIYVVNLLDTEGIRRIFTDMASNFTNFPPLGVVLITIIGIGVAEQSGFFSTFLKLLLSRLPNWLAPLILIFAAVNSSMMADAGLIILPPLGGLIFKSIGKKPIAGVLCAFAAVNGGFSANLFITGLDPLLAEFTRSAANLIEADYQVYATANYYFMFASTFLVSAVCFFVTMRVVEPKLAKDFPENNSAELSDIDNKVSSKEMKAVWFSIFSIMVLSLITIYFTISDNAIFRIGENDYLPLFKSIIPLIMIFFLVAGFVYGLVIGSIKSGKDLVRMMNDSMAGMSSYIVMAFFIAQFISYFGWSNIGIISAIKGAEVIKGIGLEGIPLMMFFFIFCVFINLMISSASAKWAILAPVFVPMFILLGISPEATQLVYRVGDSTTNMVTPMLPYFPILIVFAKKFEPNISFGDLISNLVPFSMFLILIWGAFMGLWFWFDLPIGPNNYLFLKP